MGAIKTFPKTCFVTCFKRNHDRVKFVQEIPSLTRNVCERLRQPHTYKTGFSVTLNLSRRQLILPHTLRTGNSHRFLCTIPVFAMILPFNIGFNPLVRPYTSPIFSGSYRSKLVLAIYLAAGVSVSGVLLFTATFFFRKRSQRDQLLSSRTDGEAQSQNRGEQDIDESVASTCKSCTEPEPDVSVSPGPSAQGLRPLLLGRSPSLPLTATESVVPLRRHNTGPKPLLLPLLVSYKDSNGDSAENDPRFAAYANPRIIVSPMLQL